MDCLPTLRKLSAHGIAISFDNDDNQTLSEVGYDGSGVASLKGRRYNRTMFRETIEMAKLADVLTTTNDLIAQAYRSAGVQDVAVVENHLDSGMFGFGSRSKHDGVVVGWVAAHEHEPDLDRLPLTAALRRLLEVHSELHILTVGVRLPLASERYRHVKRVDFADLLKITRAFDIGIAPLADTAFNRSRSRVKLKEYGAGGAMWLASPVGPYLGLGESEGGLLVDDEAWFSTIDMLIRNSRVRKRLSKRALRWAKRQTIDHHVARWEMVFAEAISRAQARTRSR
jgi:hypothetical protein